MMKDAIQWGVLGVANIATRAVIPAIQRSGNGRLAVIASRERARAEDAAREFKFARAYGSYEALLDDPDVQAVYIPLPNALHREWTIRCAESGKHVLCEKPLALSPAECDEMIAACAQHRVLLMEAFMYRFHPRTEEVARLVRAGELGEARMVRAAFTFRVTNRANNIRFRPDLGGGALYDVGCYTVNVSRMVLGEPEEVFAAGRIGESGVDEQVSAVLRFGGGRLAVIDCGLSLPRREEYEVIGTEGHLRVLRAFLPGSADSEIEISRASERTSRSIPGAEQYQRMVEHFGQAIETGSALGLPPDDASRNVAVISSLLASLRSGRPESLAH